MTAASAPNKHVDPEDAAKLTLELGAVNRLATRRFPLGYRGHHHQRCAHRLSKLPGVDVIVLNCGRRSGKSEFAGANFIDMSLDDYEAKRRGRGRWHGHTPQRWKPAGKSPDPFLHYACVAPTYTLLDPLKRKFQRMLGLVDQGGLITYQTTHEWWLIGGIRIDWRTGDRPDMLVADAYDGVLLDEFARIKADVWEDHLQPALADTGGWAQILSTPLSKASAFYRVWALGDPLAASEIRESTGEDVRVLRNVKCISWTTMDNTMNPRIQKWAVEAKGRMPDAMWRRNFTASWVAFHGQVFTELDDRKHVARIDPYSIRRIFAGMDFGWRNPAVFSVWCEDSDGLVHELESVLAKHRPTDGDDAWRGRRFGNESTWTTTAWTLLNKWSQFCQYSTHNWAGVPVYLPHDNPQAVKEFENRGFNVSAAYLDRADGLEWFKIRFHNDEITIATPAVWRSFESLIHPENAFGREAELWDKAKSDDHGFDAARYACSEQIMASDRGHNAPIPFSVYQR
jgi:hypothetical protein